MAWLKRIAPCQASSGRATRKYFRDNVNPLKKIIALITSLLASLMQHSLAGSEMLWNHQDTLRLHPLALIT
jgi:hypothetical protein